EKEQRNKRTKEQDTETFPSPTPGGEGLATEQVAHWQQVFDETHDAAPVEDATFNIAGWRSSYTGQPIPAAEMRVWVDQTVDRIAALKPQRVLEIGCGTGLLLFPLAPGCVEYVATDFAAGPLCSVADQLKRQPLPHVTLLQRAADQIDDFPAAHFDTVILNSVVQYFPSRAYLERVIERAIERTAPHGTIVLGDLRSYTLLEAFHTSVQLHQAMDSLTLRQLRQQVRQRVVNEEELAIDPGFFAALRRRCSRIGRVAVQLKRGTAPNEMTRFRYDVLLYLDDEPAATALDPLDWRQDGLTIDQIRARLTTEQPAYLAVRNVPNARVLAHVEAAAQLATVDEQATVATLRTALHDLPCAGIDPEDLWRLGDNLPYSVEIAWANSGDPAAFDVLFRHHSAPAIALMSDQPALRTPGQYTNNPLAAKVARTLVPELRAMLKAHLPDYMLPSAFVVLDALPLTPNDKVDRGALPAPDPARWERETDYAAPETAIETLIAGVWSALLDVPQVGRSDSFFELGGHSLLATQVVARLREALAVEVPLRLLFDTPRLAELAQQVDALRQNATNTVLPPLVAQPRPPRLPLSFAQQRLWFIDQLQPHSTAYHIPTALRLHGPLDLAALQRSLHALIERHEVLRTTFVGDHGTPLQVIHPPAPVTLPRTDLRDLPSAERAERARTLAEQIIQAPFDLATGPLLRLHLLRLDNDDHVLVLVLHHSIGDGWSIGVFVRDLSTLYTAYHAGTEPDLPELPVQYADYTLWQRQWLQGSTVEQLLDYWREHLSPAGSPLPVLALPTDRARPAQPSDRGGSVPVRLSAELASALQQLSQTSGTTLFMTLLAGWAVVLARWGGQAEIMVGTPVAGRTATAAESLIGFFVNTLALRLDLTGDPSFRDLLSRVRQVMMGAYAHQDVPFEQVVDAVQPQRDLRRHPLFQVLFALQNAPLAPLRLPDLTVEPVPLTHISAQFDLSVSVSAADNGIFGDVVYSADLFEPSTVANLVEQWALLLRAVVAEPQQSIATVRLLSDDAAAQLIDTGRTRAGCVIDETLAERFARQALRTPDAIALVDGDERLTYRELDRRANQLAHLLIARGVGARSHQGDVAVGLCVERSIAVVVGILGVLKAGGCYVPLDPAYPAERLRFMAEDAGLTLIVTHAPARAALPWLDESPDSLLCLDRDAQALDQQPVIAPPLHTTPDHAAYVIYTSGSTGQPKGVVVPHAQVLRLFDATSGWFHFDAQDVWTLFHSYAFDFSVWELWGALLYGGRLVVVPYWVSRDPQAFYALVRSERVTVLNQTPSAFRAFSAVDAEAGADLALRAVIFGGEALDLALLQPWVARHGDAQPQLINMYGITETTVHVTYRRLSQADITAATGSMIGLAIPDLALYLLDGALQPVPVGVVGELYVGGAGLARGYLNRPDLTAERFLPDPFGTVPGGRLYRTGDLARWTPGGELAYVGRNDQQIKVRGFRIEVGEITAALLALPEVRDAVILAHTDATGDTRLRAYVVAQPGQTPTTSALRRALQQRLPDYMVPGTILVLDALPLTPNGKLDRGALPEPDAAEQERDEAYAAPETPVEVLIAGVWSALLDVPQVGRRDSFFELGGHSLLATQVVARLREALAVEVPLRLLFDTPRLAELAQQVDALRQRETPGVVLPPLGAQPRPARLPLSFAQQRLWFIDQLQPHSTAYHIPTALRLHGPLDVAALERSLYALIARHEVLRTTFVVEHGTPLQLIHPPAPLSLPFTDLRDIPSTEREERARTLAEQIIQAPFDLAVGPLLRLHLLRLDNDDHVLVLVLHHSIGDGWSLGILTRELAALSAANGDTEALPPLPIQYADYVLWQRQWLSGQVLEQQIAYWRQQLAGAPPLLTLPTDRPRPPVQQFQGAEHSFIIPPDLHAALLRLSQQSGATLFMTLLAAWQVLLARYSGQDDIVVGSPIANRTRVEIEPLIGFFVNTLVLRARLDGQLSFRSLLEQVRETTLGAYAHQDVPFEQVVDALQPQRNLSYAPLFQVVFALQNTPAPSIALESLTLSSLAIDAVVAKFDLELSLDESPAGISGQLIYNTSLFDAGTAARMAAHYGVLLESIVAAPDQPIDRVPLLSQAERWQILREWSATADLDYQPRCFHHLVVEQAARTPDAIAVVFGEQGFTYRELNARANQLAHHLQALGVTSEVCVGLYVERSLELAIGVLAILKAGGVYVPLDPSYPHERIQFMIADSQIRLLLTQERLADQLADLGLRSVCLDADWPTITREAEQAPVSTTDPDNLAYIIYTSGSTGTPKGVLVAHRGLANLAQTQIAAFGVDSTSRVLQFASLSFDAAVSELAMAWLSGATLVLAPQTALMPSELRATLQDQAITHVTLPPSVAAALPDVADLPALRTVIFAGEASTTATIERWLTADGRRRLLNAYGPTETTVCATVSWIADAERVPPIGRSIANTQVYLLDADMQPVPVGVVGEIYIGGVGIARGYQRRPDLTAERFVPDPFGAEAGARLYRTGDLGRYRVDGQIEFLGRIDHQVKLRGFRIELGEIEQALAQHPGGRETIVMVREDQPGDQRLVAYVVKNLEPRPQNLEQINKGTKEQKSTTAPLLLPQPRLKPAEVRGKGLGDEGLLTHRGEGLTATLRTFLAQRLPSYMVPSAFVVLDALPLTPNGKLDRAALPVPSEVQPEHAESYVAPRTPTEELLAGIWAEVLGVARVSTRANFFALGGHSLLATRVIAQVRSAFQIDLPLTSLFESPTVADMAQQIEAAVHVRQALTIPPIHPTGADRAPLTSFQLRIWLADQKDLGNPTFNLPTAVRLHGALDLAALEYSLTTVVGRQAALRTIFVGDPPVQVIQPATPVPLPVFDLRARPERDRVLRRLIMEEAEHRFDLATGPLLRCRVARLADDEHVLLLTVHHIISDGRSQGILVRELATVYAAVVTQRPPDGNGHEPAVALPPLPIQYADYAAWEYEWLQGETIERLLGYWRQQLIPEDAPMSPLLALPTDYPRRETKTFAGDYQTLLLSAVLSEQLYELSRAESCTLFMTLLAGFNVLLWRVTGDTDIMVGTPSTGRVLAEAEPLIGLFLNMLPLRTRIAPEQTFQQLLRQVRVTTLDAYTHQYLP
ncbi:MAG TPA: amino acid adenylation domain-containing protein, partial [Herpetosiphonaceae bacterium]